MMLEGLSEIDDEKESNIPLEERGHSLLVVDMLSLHKKFSFKRYSIDLKGFGLAILFVLAIFALGLWSANLG